MSPILDAFQDLRLERLSAYARKWVEGPYDPRKRGPAWSVPIKSISLYKPIPSRGPGGYIVVFELVENEQSLTYQAAKDGEWEYRSPIPMPNGFDALSKDEQDIVRHHLDEVGMTRTGKTLSAEHSEINKLTTACGMGCTIIDYSQLIDKDFVRLVYRSEVLAASDKKALRDEWRFHVRFPDESLPEWIDKKGPFTQLYPVVQDEKEKQEPEREKVAIDPEPLKYDSLPANIEPAHVIPLALKGQAFTQGPKNNRLDNFNKAIKRAWAIALKEIGPKPTARNVYDCMEVKGNIIEKEEGDNGDPIAIHWKRSKGKEESTPYHTFENRLTRLKKKGVLPLPNSSK